MVSPRQVRTGTHRLSTDSHHQTGSSCLTIVELVAPRTMDSHLISPNLPMTPRELSMTLSVERVNVLGWSMGGFIAQTLALQQPGRINKLILLSTDPGGPDADLAPAEVWSQLIDMSGTPHEQAGRLLSLLFPTAVAESIYREFGDIVAAARAQLSPSLVNRQVIAMDAWHRAGVGDRLRKVNVPVLIATGTADVVIPPSNALRFANVIPGAWLAQFDGGGHAFMAQYPRPLADLLNSFLELG